MGWLNEAAAKYGGKQVRYIHSRRDPETDNVDPGRWITEIVRRSLHVDMGHDSCAQQFQRGQSLLGNCFLWRPDPVKRTQARRSGASICRNRTMKCCGTREVHHRPIL
jgi:hypothetical protein